MTAKQVSTHIALPPGVPSGEVVSRLIDLAFKEYRWFQPAQYGRFGDEASLEPGCTDFRALLACYDECPRLTISGRTERDYLMLLPPSVPEFPFVGKLIWATSLTEVRKAGWRDAHLLQVMEVMRLLGSSLACSGIADDLGRKAERFIPNPDGFGTEQTFTVRDPSEGLAGLFWRNFFGPPFIRLFGERLQSLPPGTVQQLGDDLLLVQPYALPTQAMTPEGDAAEQRLITLLGPECFYDFQHHRKPTRLPELPS